MNKNKKYILAGLTFVAIALGALALYLFLPITTKHNLKIPSSEPKELVRYLKEQNYSLNIIDEIFLKIFPPYQGWVYINKKELPRYQFLLALHKKGNYYTPFTIIPGETSYFVLKELSQKFSYDRKKVIQIYNKLKLFREGNFIANTYNIPNYFNEKRAVNFLLKESFKIHKKIASEYGLDYKEEAYKKFLIVASIIQKEAANTKEMPIIASVIYNRLRKNMRLQMDGTLNYGAYSHTKVTPQRIKEDKSFYNTYKFKGLPKAPICNVSTTAIEAAINPIESDYLYFMKKDEKSHLFSSTFKEHRENIKKRKEKLNKQH